MTAKVTLTEKDGELLPCRLSAPAEVTVGLPLSLKGQVYPLARVGHRIRPPGAGGRRGVLRGPKRV